MNEEKLDPDALLKAVQEEEKKASSGKLKIFFGMSAGVGKTYAMLQDGHERKGEGVNLYIGTVNTHGRQETEKLLEGLPIIPEKWIEYKDKAFKELDLEKILELKPQLVLIDELAHTNVPGSKHPKRWQDVIEILNAGIDVYTTLNVQHIESRKDLIESVTGITVYETVPDLILERATNIEIIDIPPIELLQRLKEGKVYLGNQSIIAAQNFFQEDHLTALREIALRLTAEKVDHDLHSLLAIGRGWKTRERLMVAITAAPTSQQLIRAARRLAFELDAPWVAVFVDTGSNLSSEDRNRLNKHLQLAKELGAEVITTNDIDIAVALERIAKQKNITRLVIGRPRPRSKILSFFHTSLLDRLAEENKQMDILILRQDKLVSLYKQIIPNISFTSSYRSYWVVFIFGFFVTLLGYVLKPMIGYKAVGDIFLVGILILSLFVGIGPTLLAAALSALSWDFLFIPPQYNFIIKDVNDLVLLIIYFFTALIAGYLNSRIRQRDVFLHQRGEKIEHLYEIMQQIARSPNLQYLRLNVITKLKALFSGEFEILVKGGDNQLVFDSQLKVLNDETERAAAAWSYRNGKLAGWSTDTLPAAKAIFFPIQFSKISLGILVFFPKDAQQVLSLDEQNFLTNVTEQLGIYLERYVFEEKIQNQNYMRQVEKLHNAIFRSLSKGFYTPLEKIGSLNQTFKNVAHNPEEQKLADEINLASNNLRFIVDNILIISQLESGFIQFEKKKEPIRLLIEETIKDVKTLISDRTIEGETLSEEMFFEFNYKLLKIALKNIVVNACEYSPVKSLVKIQASETETEFVISVTDQGLGIEQEIMPFIFDKFYRASGAKFEGIGLGLTIVKSIVDLHQGHLQVANREAGGGTVVSILLPKGS